MQPGDVPDTHANVDELMDEFEYKPTTKIRDGIQCFVDWYRTYYEVWINNMYSYFDFYYFCLIRSEGLPELSCHSL